MFLLLFLGGLQGNIPDSIYAKIQREINLREKDKALKIVRDYLEADTNSEDWLQLARFLRARGIREDSYTLLEEGRKKFKNPRLFSREFYSLYYRKRQYEDALKELVNILREEGNLNWIRREARRLERYLGRKNSIEILNSLSREKPEEPRINYLLADIYLRDGDFKKAAHYLKKAGETRGLVALSEEALLAGEPQIALDILNKIKGSDRNSHWYYLEGKAKVELNDYENATVSLEKALKMGEKSARDILFDILLTKLKDPEKILELTEKDTLNTYRLKAYLALGMFEKAKKLASLGATRNEDMAFFRAYLEMLTGDLTRADSLFKVFIARFPSSKKVNDALFYLELSSLLSNPQGEEVLDIERALLMQKEDVVEKRARDFLRKNQDTPLALYVKLLLADALVRQSRVGEAFGVLQSMKEGKEDFIVARGLLRAYFLARDSIGDIEEAQNILKTLILKFPDSPYADVARSFM